LPQMNATWAAFARHGDPMDELWGAWPTYEPTRRSTMNIDEVTRLVDDPMGSERMLWSL